MNRETDTNTSALADEKRVKQYQEEKEDEDVDVDADHEVDDLEDSKPKKKRRIVKLSDKKYECPHPECGKAYSRAEHLYRHQLNHSPKQIYHCDFPGCDRSFVRADLRARHKERHTAKGSHLQRKDAFINSQRTSGVSGATPPSGSTTVTASPVDVSHAIQSTPINGYAHSGEGMHGYPPPHDQFQGGVMSELTPLTTSNLDPQLGTYSAFHGNMNGSQHPGIPQSAPVDGHRFSYDGTFAARPASLFNGFNQNQHLPMNAMQAPPTSSPQPGTPLYTNQPYPSPTSTNQNFRSPSRLSSLPSLPPFGIPQGYGASSSVRSGSGSGMSPPIVGTYEQPQLHTSRSNSLVDYNAFDPIAAGYAMPVFGNESTFNRSPPAAVDDNFLNMLFNSNEMELNDPSPPEIEPVPPPPVNVPLPKLEPDGTPSDQNAAALSKGMDLDMPESKINDLKHDRLVKLVSGFAEIERNPGRKKKSEILAGDPQGLNHVMSIQMLKTYMTSYWLHIHQQMPILHRPTFNPETCPDLLILAMMCLGALCLEEVHPTELSQRSTELAFFVVYHIRWEIFKDAEFRPTAKLWTFQAMLLLELFEKMYSTRTLHERAHIHHATTLVVMRRGSSLVGRSAIDSNEDDITRTPPGPEGSINTSGQNTADPTWNRWITAEATRRAAFAAFVIDSTHATLFGHSAVMAPHDIRLPLPCDEPLWSATSMAEVQRVEASLAANGVKPTTFLDALRRTLNGQKVRTNTFGRVILMAGLLNVSWHMNQRDLQVSSLGAASTLGNQIKWRLPLTRAFDYWRKDFDESLSKNEQWQLINNSKSNDRNSIIQRDNVFESRTCLHSLAHMAMHVDIIDCQVFAGADRALGRLVTDGDRAAVQKKMREHWAPSARARDATFYALRFLCEVLIPEEELGPKRSRPDRPPTFIYNARDDYLLNRPWVLFFAALIVWSYGYALEGPIRPSNYTLTSRELQIRDMQRYLIRMGGVAGPDELEKLMNRNSCLGLLLLLRERFQQPRWELLHEASKTLSSCIDLLVPGRNSENRP